MKGLSKLRKQLPEARNVLVVGCKLQDPIVIPLSHLKILPLPFACTHACFDAHSLLLNLAHTCTIADIAMRQEDTDLNLPFTQARLI